MSKGDVFNNPGWKEMVIGVSLFCNAHFNNSHITLETQGWTVQLTFFFQLGLNFIS